MGGRLIREQDFNIYLVIPKARSHATRKADMRKANYHGEETTDKPMDKTLHLDTTLKCYFTAFLKSM